MRTWKRTIAGILGLLSFCAGLVIVMRTVDVFADFPNPIVPAWQDIAGLAVFCLVTLTALTLGVRFLSYAFSGTESRSRGKLYSVFLGIACAIPGFLFSLPLSFALAFRGHRTDAHADDLALGISGAVALISAITGCVLLLKKNSS